jgi:hypothetical protein
LRFSAHAYRPQTPLRSGSPPLHHLQLLPVSSAPAIYPAPSRLLVQMSYDPVCGNWGQVMSGNIVGVVCNDFCYDARQVIRHILL